MSKFVGTTIQLSDTVDSYARKVHVNVRGKKVTLVNRWKDRASDKAHTQRTTLDDGQVSRLIAALTVSNAYAMGGNDKRTDGFIKRLEDTAKALIEASEAK